MAIIIFFRKIEKLTKIELISLFKLITFYIPFCECFVMASSTQRLKPHEFIENNALPAELKRFSIFNALCTECTTDCNKRLGDCKKCSDEDAKFTKYSAQFAANAEKTKLCAQCEVDLLTAMNCENDYFVETNISNAPKPVQCTCDAENQ